MNNLWNRQWTPFEKSVELLPQKTSLAVSAIEPSLPYSAHSMEKQSERQHVSRDTVVTIMTSYLRTKFPPLLQNRFVPIPATPLLNLLDATSKPRLHCLTLHHQVALLGFSPIVRKTKQVKRL